MSNRRLFGALLVLGVSAVSTLSAQSDATNCVGATTRVRGTVRRVSGAPVANAAVSIAWNAIVLHGLYVSNVRCIKTATSAADGSFTADSVPDDEAALVVAEPGDGTAGVAVRHALVDNAAPLVVFVPAANEVTPASTTCMVHGMVVTIAGTPVPNANINVNGSDAMRTDGGGRFASANCDQAGGSFVVRALSLARAEFWVSTPTPVRAWVLALDRSVPRLSEVVVRAPSEKPRDVTGFEERRRQGFGHFVTRFDIETRRPTQLPYLFEGIAGMRVNGNTVIFARGANTNCVPRLFLDGTQVLAGAAVLSSINPTDVYGIELYSGAGNIPVQFQGMGGGGVCGVIVVWTRNALDRDVY
jgi:hypothetical protein